MWFKWATMSTHTFELSFKIKWNNESTITTLIPGYRIDFCL